MPKKFKGFYLVALMLALGITVAACTPQEQQEAADTLTGADEVNVVLSEQNNSGQSGNVELTEENGQTRVVVNVNNAPEGTQQPAHIHLSSCDTIGGVKYPLNSLVNGTSDTLVDATLSELTGMEQLSINVHKSNDEISTYVACGNLPFETSNGAMMEDDNSMAEGGDAMMEDDNSMAEGGDAMMEDDGAQDAVKEFVVGGTNFEFDMNEIRVNQGDRVKITFTSNGGFHDWVVDEFDAATSRVNAGETATVEFVADEAGTFEYYCSVGSHRALGMVGNLIVE